LANARAVADLERANRRLVEVQAELVQSAKMSAVGQLAAGVSHEVRNPLHVIAGSIYFLRAALGDAPPKVREHLGHIESEVARAVELTQKLLDFARPAGPREPLDASAVVGRALPLLARMIEGRGVALEARLADGLPPVEGSAGELQQVVVNLLLNAAQALERRDGREGGRIGVATSAAGGEVRIEVEDDGAGIAPGDLGRLFEPFFTRREGGTGLGLFVCWGIVERHGGKIEVASEVGKGTRFTVRLPAPQLCESPSGSGGLIMTS
ncbi:MAG TPA: ATP-binding protein, partial [Labilithrix sp.]